MSMCSTALRMAPLSMPRPLADAGIIKNTRDGIKILGRGELERKLTVIASAFSASAKEKIEAAGGKAEVK